MKQLNSNEPGSGQNEPQTKVQGLMGATAGFSNDNRSNRSASRLRGADSRANMQ